MPLFTRKKLEPPPPPPEPHPPLEGAPSLNEQGYRTVASQRDFLLTFMQPLPPFGMGILDAVGLALCEDLTSDRDIPVVDVALVEGYAVSAGDVSTADADQPVTLECVGELHAGEQATEPLPSGTCVRIVPGVPMPDDSNAVVPLADAVEQDDDVTITLTAHPGQGVRSKGHDIADGAMLLKKDDILGARMIGMLAGAGIDRVMARPRPRVVVISNGPELVEPGLPLKNISDIYDADSFMIAAAARAEGATVFRVGVYSNDPLKVKDQISDQLIRADLVITTGGVSTDGYDLIASIIPFLGRSDFCEVAMEPGRRLGFGIIGLDEVPIIMLPGNPMGAYVSYETFVRPLIRAMMGKPPTPDLLQGVTHTHVSGSLGKTTFIPARYETLRGGRISVEPFSNAASHQLGDLARANSLIVLDEETETVAAGGIVKLWPFVAG